VHQIKTKSGVLIKILKEGEPKDGICFLEDEYLWAKKLALNFSQDPEALKSFWASIIEEKQKNINYSVFDSFPKVEEIKSTKPTELDICRQTIEMLRSGGARTKEEKESSS